MYIRKSVSTVRHGRAMFSAILLFGASVCRANTCRPGAGRNDSHKSKEKIKTTVSSFECFIFDTRTV